MNTHKSTFKLFAESKLSDYLKQNGDRIQFLIDQTSDDDILHKIETENINPIVGKCTVNTINVDFDKKKIGKPYEKLIPAELFSPIRFNVTPGESYPKQAVTYYLPYTGDQDLFRYTPSRRKLWTTEVFFEDQYLCFEVFSLYSRPEDIAEDIKKKANEIIDFSKTQLENLKSEIDNYNDQLPTVVKQFLEERKQTILDKNKIVELLDTPIKE